jgi:hypothetical protein
MKDLHIQPTKDTPEVIFSTGGLLKITGKALPEDSLKFFKELYAWIREFQSDKLQFDIKLEYFNTSVSKCLMDMFKIAEENKFAKEIHCTWQYEEGDDDNYEAGHLYQDLTKRIKFVFHEYAEAIP